MLLGRRNRRRIQFYSRTRTDITYIILIFEPVCTPVSPINARPPTSAVDGRKVNPIRRTAGLLFILAALVRELRPTVFTALDSLERVVSLLCNRVAATPRSAPCDASDDVVRADVFGALIMRVGAALVTVATRDVVLFSVDDLRAAAASDALLFAGTAREFTVEEFAVSVLLVGIKRDGTVAAITGSVVNATKNPKQNPFILGIYYITREYKKKEKKWLESSQVLN